MNDIRAAKETEKNHLILSQHIKETIGRLILVNTNNFFFALQRAKRTIMHNIEKVFFLTENELVMYR